MSFALISSTGVVMQIAAAEFPVAPPVQWVNIAGVTPAPEVGWTYNGSVFAAPPAAPAPTMAQQAAAALSAGVAIVSTGTSALNATYPCDPTSQQKIQAISLFILVNSKFPGGSATYPWLDMSGTAHTFPTTAEFQAFATAVADYVASLDLVIAGAASSLPASPVTIA